MRKKARFVVLKEVLIVQGIVTLLFGLYLTGVGLSIDDPSQITGNQIRDKINNLDNLPQEEQGFIDKQTLAIIGIMMALSSFLEVMGVLRSFFNH